ncbi:MAG: 6-bladed beta-propeller [Gammaproteobacteria bacterium]
MPRYRFVGQLTGEENFQAAEDSGSIGKKMLAWIVGLVSGQKQPVVLQRPQSGFVDDEGRIYVTDVSRAAVYVFDKNRARLDVWEMAAKMTRFVSPVGIGKDAIGNIVVADAELGWIAVLDKNGEPVRKIEHVTLKRPTGLAVNIEQNLIYVADSRAHDIKVFSMSGQLTDVWGQRGEQSGQFNGPTYLAFRDDKLYVTDTLNSRIQVFSQTGEHLQTFGKRGLYVGDLPRPKGITVDSHGNIYVVESYYDYLLIFNAKGEFLLPIGGTGDGIGQFVLPAGVWTDQQDRVYVADAFNGRIVIFQYLEGA